MEKEMTAAKVFIILFVGTAFGCVLWFSLFSDIHIFKQQVKHEDRIEKQEARAAISVGAAEKPKSAVKVDVKYSGCISISKADLDGATMVLYAKNGCHHSVDYLEWHWTVYSPDGTALHAGYTNQCPKPDVGHQAECVFSPETYNRIPLDDRTDTIRVWTEIQP